jgi:hypothetical protein
VKDQEKEKIKLFKKDFTTETKTEIKLNKSKKREQF